MKIIFLSSIVIFLLIGCGKKSNPEYQTKHEQEILIIS